MSYNLNNPPELYVVFQEGSMQAWPGSYYSIGAKLYTKGHAQATANQRNRFSEITGFDPDKHLFNLIGSRSFYTQEWYDLAKKNHESAMEARKKAGKWVIARAKVVLQERLLKNKIHDYVSKNSRGACQNSVDVVVDDIMDIIRSSE